MTEKEIVTSFRQAKNRERQVAILAQLNACTTGDIVEVLLKNGFTPKDIPGRYRKGGKRARKTYHREHQVPPPKRDTKTGKWSVQSAGHCLTVNATLYFAPPAGKGGGRNGKRSADKENGNSGRRNVLPVAKSVQIAVHH